VGPDAHSISFLTSNFGPSLFPATRRPGEHRRTCLVFDLAMGSAPAWVPSVARSFNGRTIFYRTGSTVKYPLGVPWVLVDRNGRMRSIRRPRRPGALQALMAASGGPARLVTHRQMGSSLRHPILATDHLERRPSGLRPAPPPTVTVHSWPSSGAITHISATPTRTAETLVVTGAGQLRRRRAQSLICERALDSRRRCRWDSGLNSKAPRAAW